MLKILNQWKIYIELVHYKVFIKKKLDRLLPIVEKIKKRYDILKSEEMEYLGKINAETKNVKGYDIYLKGVKQIKSKFNFPFKKVNGYIAYLDKTKSLKIIGVKDIGIIQKIKNRELYGIDEKVGTYKNKPLYLIIYPNVMSLKVKGENVFYDAMSFYNYSDTVTKINLTSLGKSINNLGEFIQKNFMLVLIIIIALILFLTPQGKEILNGMITK